MYLHAGREEAPTAQRVGNSTGSTEGPHADPDRAKYIEGLENRLARMESLMRLSGVLPEDDDGSTDLATLERRLADRAGQQSGTPKAPSPHERRASSVRHTTEQPEGTPAQPGLPSPRSGTTSPEPQEQQQPGKGKDEDALAEMMCSLVTNNCGETRYIGGYACGKGTQRITDSHRIILRLLHFLTKGHTMGQRKDGRRIVPGNDIDRRHRRQQMDTMAARRLSGHLQATGIPTTPTEARSIVFTQGLLRKFQLHVPAIPRADIYAPCRKTLLERPVRGLRLVG